MKESHMSARRFSFLIYFITVILSTTPLSAGIYWSLGYNLGIIAPNTNLSVNPDTIRYFNGELGLRFDSGLSLFARYDHIDIEDHIVNSNNVRVVAVLPSLGAGYSLDLFEKKMGLSFNVLASYSPSVRYRLDIVDYKTSGFAFAASSSLFIQIVGHFYIGVEAGYRYFTVDFAVPSQFQLDLGGFFCGVTLRHQY